MQPKLTVFQLNKKKELGAINKPLISDTSVIKCLTL